MANGKTGLGSLITDFQGLLALISVGLGFAVVLLALGLGVAYPSANQTTGTALQIGSSVILAILGFYFGRKGVDQETKRADLAQAKAADAEESQKDSLQKVTQAHKDKERAEDNAEQASEALEGIQLANDALKDHYADHYAEAETKYLRALDHGLPDKERAQVLTNLAYLLLNLSQPDYPRIAGLLRDAQALFHKLPERDEFWTGLLDFGLGLAEAHLGNNKSASRLLNAVGTGIQAYNYLFQDGNLRQDHLAPVLGAVSELSDPVRKQLSEAAKIARAHHANPAGPA